MFEDILIYEKDEVIRLDENVRVVCPYCKTIVSEITWREGEPYREELLEQRCNICRGVKNK